MSLLELVAAAFSAVSVLLTVRRSLWLWPAGIVGTALYLAVFAEAKLYGSASLQVFFLAIQVYGWWWWTRRGQDGEEPLINRMRPTSTAVLAVLALLVAAVAAWAMSRFSDARAAPADMTITMLSVVAQWLLSRKMLESWLFWIAVDVLAIWVYASQALYVTAGLYGLFLVMAIWGLVEWRKAWSPQARPK